MAKGVHGEALQHVRMLFEAGAVGGLTDRQLLERFRTRDGEAAEWAFAALVERHGPMILRVCRRTLRDEHAAQDAFQATFLVLVRKAGSLRAEGSLGGWLHSVACRVAACARGAEARRRAHERRAALTVDALTVDANGGGDDLGPALHEEIGRLPEAYRTAVVLCDLEGLTQDQAAQRLGCPSGTVRSRLARGRGRLRARLIRRGLTPLAGPWRPCLASEGATAAAAGGPDGSHGPPCDIHRHGADDRRGGLGDRIIGCRLEGPVSVIKPGGSPQQSWSSALPPVAPP